jgi:uncharacterized protein (DUF58 family)
VSAISTSTARDGDAGGVRFRLTRRAVGIGGGALILFGVGTNVQAGWVLVVAALMLGILVAGLVYPLRALSGIEVTRRVPATATAGQQLGVDITITNASRRMRVLVRATDDFCGKGWAVAGLLFPRQSRTFASRRTEVRRGVYTSGECVLDSGAPFGVVQAARTVSLRSPLTVYPRVYDIDPKRMTGPGGWPELAAVGDVSSVRDYRPGDPLRHIHWRSVARRGRLVVREFDHERHADIAIVADPPADPDAADAVASVACSLALGARNGGREVSLVSASNGAARSTSGRTVDAVLDWGARLNPSGTSLSALLRAAGEVPAVVCVCDGSDLGALVDIASGTSLFVVIVGEADAGRLVAAGADVATLAAGEVEAWFRAGCPAS